MLLLDSQLGCILLMLGGMLLLGTWPAVWNHVEKAGRPPTHIFLDYSCSYLASSLFYSLLLGSFGAPEENRPNILDQLPQDNGQAVAFAVCAGMLLFMGDMSMQYGVALLGMSVAMPLINSLEIIISVVINFFLDAGLNKKALLFPGAACFVVATAFGALAYLQNAAHMRRKVLAELDAKRVEALIHVSCISTMVPSSGGATHTPTRDHPLSLDLPQTQRWAMPVTDALSNPSHSGAVQRIGSTGGLMRSSSLPGPAHLPWHADLHASALASALDAALAAAPSRSIPAGRHSKYLGLLIAIFGGTVYGLVYPALNLAINDPWGFLPPGVPPLSIYGALFYFGSTFAFCSMINNIILLYRPLLGTPKSSVTAWMRDNRKRGWSLFAGVLTPSGSLAQVMGGESLGFAASMMVNAFPLVGTMWGLILFKEFRGTSRLAGTFLGLQIVLYIGGIALLAASTSSRDQN